jgi:hypothetical protein
MAKKKIPLCPVSDSDGTSRPTGYDETVAEKVLERISEGELLMRICQESGMPTRGQFRHWLTTHDDLAAAYARERLFWADAHAEAVVDLVTDPKGNFIDQNGNRLPLTHEEVAALRLRVDSIKWLVGKWAPRTYGEKPDLPPEQAHVVTRICRTIVDPHPAALPAPPLQLTFDPGPLPASLDSEILARIIAAVKKNVPKAKDVDPRMLLNEVIDVVDRALRIHYGPAAETSSA